MDFETIINNLTKNELIMLNRIIFKRIKYLDNLKLAKNCLLFDKGQLVSFEHNNKLIISYVTKDKYKNYFYSNGN